MNKTLKPPVVSVWRLRALATTAQADLKLRFNITENRMKRLSV